MKLLLVRDGAIAVASASKVFIFKTHKNDSDYEIIDVDNNSSTIVAISSNDVMSLIFIAYSNKIVYCWDIINKCVKSKITLRKCPTAMEWSKFTITINSIQKEKEVEVLILTNKSGDIIGVDVPMFTGQVLLGGHTASVITDLVNVNNKYLITADRDEKIRICQFPETDTITNFCLGHKSVITSMISFQIPITAAATISSSFLISSGWDNKIFLWNIESGLYIDSITFENVEVPETSSSSTSTSTLNVVSTGDVTALIGTPDVVIETENSSNNNAVDDSDSNNLSNQVANEDEDEDADVFEKQYDESSAGNYPAKVAVFVCPFNNILPTSTLTFEVVAYVAVIFRNLAILKVYPIISSSQENNGINTSDITNTNTNNNNNNNNNNNSLTNDDNNNKKLLKFGEPQIFTLSGVPADISFLDAKTVILILEKPMYIQIISINTTVAIVGSDQQVVDESGDYKGLDQVFQEYCKENGIEYTQQVVYSVDEHETGIRKHELDKPFNVLTGVNTTGNKGSKRSRKRNIQDVSALSEVASSSSSNSGGDASARDNNSSSS